jgi:hypothetical protein
VRKPELSLYFLEPKVAIEKGGRSPSLTLFPSVGWNIELLTAVYFNSWDSEVCPAGI